MSKYKLFYLEYDKSSITEPLPTMKLKSVKVNKKNIIEVIESVETEWRDSVDIIDYEIEFDRTQSGRPWVPTLDVQLESLITEGAIKKKDMVEEGLIDE